ncbi:flagellar assembly protein FliH [Heyndrickxia sp. NPDC080065]|uniref:flagellar assembly protein FliH n=1 Tax=Heyndrickxia sp. NPDC080065 TaxID=3390568 RepID=UPI003D0133F5
MSRIIKSHTAVNQKREAKVIGLKDIGLLNPIENIVDNDPLEVEKKKILEDYHNQAREIIDTAQLDADVIKKNIEADQHKWLEEKAKLIEEAKAEGFQIGFSEGQKQGIETYSNQIDIAVQMTNELKQEFTRHIEASEKVIFEIGMKVAEKIVQDTLTDQPEKFIPIVKHALKEAREDKDVQIFIHPNQYSLCLQNKEELDALLFNGQQIYFYPNDELNEFQCLIETSYGRIDASIDSQLSELKIKLMEILEGVPS